MIILRDDDCNFFTDVNLIKSFFSLIPRNIAIVMGIIPFIKPSVCGCVPPYLWGQSHNEFKITQNKELCILLRLLVKEGRIIPAMHGINHLYTPNLFGKLKPEFYQRKFTSEIIKLGIKEMKLATGVVPNIFIPPSNKISPYNYKLISKHFKYIFNIPSIASLSRPLSFIHLKRWSKRITESDNLLTDSPKTIKHITEISSFDFNPYRINKASKNLLQTIGTNNQRLIGIATHYWEIINEEPNNAKIYRDFLNFLLEKKVIFANNEYFLS